MTLVLIKDLFVYILGCCGVVDFNSSNHRFASNIQWQVLLLKMRAFLLNLVQLPLLERRNGLCVGSS